MITGTRELGKLVADIQAMPTEIRRELRPGLRTAGSAAKDNVGRHASWSSRIPGAVSVKVLTGKKDPGIFLRVSAARAPHARPFEGMSGNGSFRHPVFGTNTWVSQSTRPFLRLGAQESIKDVISAADQAVIAAARRAGFR